MTFSPQVTAAWSDPAGQLVANVLDPATAELGKPTASVVKAEGSDHFPVAVDVMIAE